MNELEDLLGEFFVKLSENISLFTEQFSITFDDYTFNRLVYAKFGEYNGHEGCVTIPFYEGFTFGEIPDNTIGKFVKIQKMDKFEIYTLAGKIIIQREKPLC